MKKTLLLIFAALLLCLVLTGCGNKCTVTFDTAGGTEIAAQQIKKGETITTVQEPVREGYVFVGWACLGEAWSLEENTVEGDMTLTAVWETICVSVSDEGVVTGLTEAGQTAAVIEITPTVGGVPVTSIGDNAFSYCEDLKSVTVPDSVTSIGDRAFYHCTSLKSIVIPDSVTSMGQYAFYYCTALKSVTIGNGVTAIGPYTFYDCTDLQSVIIGNSVTAIGTWAFYRCISLTSLTIPDSVTSIGSDAFYNCAALKSITLPDSITRITGGAFHNCISLTYNTHDTINYLGNEQNPYVVAMKASDHSITSCTILAGTKVIYDSAFFGCGSLTDVTIPGSVTNIGANVFKNCTDLTRITFEGTIAQWNDAISQRVNCTVHCTDGNVAK